MAKTILTRKIILYVLILSLLVLGGCSVIPGIDDNSQAQPTLPPVISDLNIVAEGVILPIQSADLSFARDGLVEDIMVEKEEAVQAGQVIAKLQGTEQLEADIASVQIDVISARQQVDNLYKNYEVQRAKANQEKVAAQRNLDKAVKVRVDKGLGRGDQNLILEAYARYQIAVENLEDLEEEYRWTSHFNPADDDRAEIFVKITDNQLSREQSLAELNWYLEGQDLLEIAVSDADIAFYTAQLEEAEKYWLELQQGPDSEDLALAEARLNTAERKLEAARKKLNDIELTVPFAGMIVTNDLKVGEVIQAGNIVVQIADLSSWKVETTDLTELDVVDISVGDDVAVSVDALPEIELAGVVEKINQFGSDLRGDITYTVGIRLDEQDERLRWNMTATVVFLD